MTSKEVEQVHILVWELEARGNESLSIGRPDYNDVGNMLLHAYIHLDPRHLLKFKRQRWLEYADSDSGQ